MNRNQIAIHAPIIQIKEKTLSMKNGMLITTQGKAILCIIIRHLKGFLILELSLHISMT